MFGIGLSIPVSSNSSSESPLVGLLWLSIQRGFAGLDQFARVLLDGQVTISKVGSKFLGFPV